MATTLNLPYVRFVRQVSNGTARSKYAYKAMMSENLAALKSAPWRRAECGPNEVTTTVNAVADTDAVRDSDGKLSLALSWARATPHHSRSSKQNRRVVIFCISD